MPQEVPNYFRQSLNSNKPASSIFATVSKRFCQTTHKIRTSRLFLHNGFFSSSLKLASLLRKSQISFIIKGSCPQRQITARPHNSSSSRIMIPTPCMYESDGNFCQLQRKTSLLGETSTSSTSTLSSSCLEISSAHQIRSRYFYKLGVIQSKPVSSLAASINKRRTLKPSHYEVLKNDLGQVDPTLSIHSRPQHATNNTKGKVCFKSNVTVHEIPHAKDYSIRTRESLWMTPEELEETAYRNCIEFAAENWNWLEAVEEPEFVLVQGTLRHPAHACFQHYNLNHQFCSRFSAQQQSRQLQQRATTYYR